MEVEVRSVAGERNCFVKLPLHVIYALQSSTETLPPLLVLELRRPKHANVWYVAWSGASSTTSCIEIPQRLAQCIGLGNSEKLMLKIIPNVSEAQSIQVEPATEDDWEMMELNAEYLEEHILNQVGVVQEGCQFPLWVQGQAALTIRAVSTRPRPVVKLVRGTELIIAPKIRENAKGAEARVGSLEGKKMVGTWLRIQELQKSVLKSYNLGTIMIKPYPTTVAFISPCTANRALLEDSQFVQLVSNAYTNTNGDTHLINKEGSTEKADLSTSEAPSDWVIGHKAIVRLLIRDDVADGHIMLCRPLCQFIGARIHARIYVQSIGQEEGELPTSATISPAVGKEVPSKQVIGIKNAQQTTGVAKRDYNYLDFEELFVMALNDCKEEIADSSRKREHFGNAALELLKAWIKLQSSIGDGKQFLLREKTIVAFSVQKQQSSKAINIPIISDAVSFARRHHKDYLFVLDLASSKKVKQSTFVLSEDLFTSNYNKIALHLELDHPLFLPHIPWNHINKKEAPLLESLSWLHPVSSQALTRLKVILSHVARESMAMLGTPTPGGLLLHGPPACGKTQFSLAVARELEDDPQTLAHCVIIRCTDFYGEQEQFIRKSLQDAFGEAVTYAPSLVILDDLDVLIPATDSQGSDPPTSVAVLVEYLSDLMDAIQCHSGSYVAFLATAKGAEALPVSIRSSGRFDFYLALPAPAAKERAEMLGSAVTKRGLLCMESVVHRAASNCDGYDASDLDVLMDRVVHAAAARFLSASSRVDGTETDLKQAMDQDTKHILPLMQKASFELVDEDFNAAFINFSPAAIRGISKNKTEETRRGWEDVGGLFDVQQALQEMLELPVKYGNLFSKSPLRLRTGVLLYGPPGCGKTHLVGAAAAAASLRFISVKGPELLNKYIGASEQAVRDIFSKAGAAAPCILFFDEFDAIAPKRGHDNTGVTDRVVNQFLTELDGVEALNGVFVFAATSRPDLLDAALLRPGRLDRLLYCGFPSRKDRLEILHVLSQQLPLADDVDFEYIAAQSEGFSGADLQALLSDAQLEAVHRCLELSQDKIPVPQAGRTNPVITMSILNSTMLTTRPSVADSERQRLMNIYDEFLSGRNPGVAKTRDIKGKRATLA